MSRSKGTKATQGINGAATALQWWLDNMPAPASAIGEPCPYGDHRPTDWVTPTSQVICGRCHPPAAEFDGITRRGEAGFDELALEARKRVIPRESTDDLEPRAQRLELDEEEPVDVELITPALRSLLTASPSALEAELDAELDAALEVDR